ncbi:hypothetical protein SUDANB25_01753 [Streptomyces sp. SudanB25_2051]
MRKGPDRQIRSGPFPLEDRFPWRAVARRAAQADGAQTASGRRSSGGVRPSGPGGAAQLSLTISRSRRSNGMSVASRV